MNVERINEIRAEAVRRRRDFEFTRQPELKAMIAADNSSWANQVIPEIDEAHRQVEAEYWRHHEIHHGARREGAVMRELDDEITEGRTYQRGFWFFLTVEIISAAVLAGSFFRGSIFLTIPAAILLAVVVSKAMIPPVARHIRHSAENQGPKMKERVGRWFLLLIPWSLSILGALMVLRGGAISMGGLLFQLCTAAITILSPALAAVCEAAAPLFLWSKNSCAKLNLIRLTARAVDTLRQTSRPAIGSSTPTPVPTAWTHLLTAVRVGVLALLIFWLTPAPSFAQPTVKRIDYLIYPDNSPSVNRQKLKKNLDKVLSAVGETQDEMTVRLIPFDEDGWTAQELIHIELPGKASLQCGQSTDELSRISKAYQAQDRERCDKLREKTFNDIVSKRSMEIKRLWEAVQSLLAGKPTGACTAVYDLLDQAAHGRAGTIAIVLSDFWDDCRRTAPESLRQQPKNRVYALPVAGNRGPRSDSENFEAIRSRLKTAAPFVIVIEPFRVNEIFAKPE